MVIINIKNNTFLPYAASYCLVKEWIEAVT